jgi:hypothetical protein
MNKLEIKEQKYSEHRGKGGNNKITRISKYFFIIALHVNDFKSPSNIQDWLLGPNCFIICKIHTRMAMKHKERKWKDGK